MKRVLPASLLAAALLHHHAFAGQTVLEDLMDRSDIVAHVKVLEIEGGEVDEEGVIEWRARCRKRHIYKWAVKSREFDAIRFRFQQFEFLKGEEDRAIPERTAVEVDGEYIVFLKDTAGAVRFAVDDRLRPAYVLADRWVGAQPYSPYLGQLLKRKKERHVKQAQADYRRLCAVWRKTKPAEGKKGKPVAMEPVTPVTEEERRLLFAELDRTYAGWFAHDFRSLAAQALGNLGNREAGPKLIAILNDTREQPGVRASAAEALGKIGDDAALGPLLSALAEGPRSGPFGPEYTVMISVARAIRGLSPGADAARRFANKRLFGRLLDILDGIEIPKLPERRFVHFEGGELGSLRMPLTSSDMKPLSKCAWRINSVCAGLNVYDPERLDSALKERAAALARRILESDAGGGAVSAHPGHESMARFCRTYQPELFAEMTKAARGG